MTNVNFYYVNSRNSLFKNSFLLRKKLILYILQYK